MEPALVIVSTPVVDSASDAKPNKSVPVQRSPLTVTPSGLGKSVTVTRLSL